MVDLDQGVIHNLADWLVRFTFTPPKIIINTTKIRQVSIGKS